MALYSNYPLDSARYMLIDSTYRNRILFPYPTEFDINLPNNKKEVKEENTGVNAIDPIYDGYPLEFGYFGSSSNDISNYPNGLQLSESASSSSNFYSRLIVQDETVYPRDYATIISYDSTTATTGYSKSAIISGWVKGTPNTGNPGSLYSIRKSLPVAQGSCWVMPNPSQVNLVNTGGYVSQVDTPKTNLVSFESDYNTDIDYNIPTYVYPGQLHNENIPCYGPCLVGAMNKSTGEMRNILASGYKNGNARKWKPNTKFFIGNILYVVSGTETRYYVVVQTGKTGDVEPTSVSLNTVINDPVNVVASGTQYVYKGTSYPLRKKWFPATHYDLGDVIGIYCLTYVVVGSVGLGLTGSNGSAAETFVINVSNNIPVTAVNGDLSLYFIPWYSTDPGFGFPIPYKNIENLDPNSITIDSVILQGMPITGNWAPSTYLVEGTFIQTVWAGYTFLVCVYKSGISGTTPPDIYSGEYDFGIIKDGSAYLMVRLITSYFYTNLSCFVVVGNPFPSAGSTIYAGMTYIYFNGAYQLLCVQEGTMGNWLTLVYNASSNTYTFSGGTAVFTRTSYFATFPYTLSKISTVRLLPFQRAPYTVNPRLFPSTQRYPVNPWSANASFSTGEYLYYGTLTFDVIQGGITGNTPPTDTYKQTNGTVVITKVSYTDPYKGSLLKITQVEDNDNQFKPYYARISYYNPNTNIVHLETPLPITEKRCLYEILQFSGDNYNPLEFTFSPFFSNISTPMIFYDITLTSITIPNLPVYSANNVNVLTSSQPQPFDSYPKLGSFPFIIVTLRNTKNSTQSIPICSNNPSEYKSTFRIPVSDPNPNLTSPFTRLYGNETVTMYLNPNDNLRFTITDPDGNLIVFANPLFFTEFIEFAKNNTVFPDTIRYIGGNKPGFGLGWVMGDLLPIPPSLTGQVSVCFSIRPHV